MCCQTLSAHFGILASMDRSCSSSFIMETRRFVQTRDGEDLGLKVRILE